MAPSREERHRSARGYPSRRNRLTHDDAQHQIRHRSRWSRRYKQKKRRAQREAPVLSHEVEQLVLPNNNGAFSYTSASIRFCSASEAACAILLECFVPDFTVQEGISFQIPLTRNTRGHIRAIDFCIGDVLVEYHPIPKARLYRKRRIQQLPKVERARAFEERRLLLLQRYSIARLRLIRQHPELSMKEFLVVGSPHEFYEQVICRFSPCPPPKEKFLALFFGMRNSIEATATGGKQIRRLSAQIEKKHR